MIKFCHRRYCRCLKNQRSDIKREEKLMKKKLLTVALVIAMVFAMAACGSSGDGDAEKTYNLKFSLAFRKTISRQRAGAHGRKQWKKQPMAG